MKREALSARESILGRIREALPGVPVNPRLSYDQIKRDYICDGSLTHESLLELFRDRLLDYDAEILDVAGVEDIPEAISTSLKHSGGLNLLAPELFPSEWLPRNVRIIRDTGLSTPQIDAESAVVTTCEAAVASTGTIMLVHARAQGRRVLTLLPDHHICLVSREQIYETVAEAILAVAPYSRQPITSISGPSATSDIEMTRVRGVHGPRRLTVILYG